jgi:hypothetical protein
VRDNSLGRRENSQGRRTDSQTRYIGSSQVGERIEYLGEVSRQEVSRRESVYKGEPVSKTTTTVTQSKTTNAPSTSQYISNAPSTTYQYTTNTP